MGDHKTDAQSVTYNVGVSGLLCFMSSQQTAYHVMIFVTSLLCLVLSTDSISYNDFCDIMRKEKPVNKESLIKAFKCIDINGDGFITYDELFRLLTKV